MQPQTVSQLVDLTTFDLSRAITLRDAVRAGLLNLKGKRPNVQVAQRWANPNRGWLASARGPRLVLPTVKHGRERLLMPEWCEAWMRERAAIVVQTALALQNRGAK